MRKYILNGRRPSWPHLFDKYGLSRETATLIEATEPPIERSRQEQPVQIVQLANDAYDAKSGRVDWEAVTGKAGLPLIECLEQLEAAGTRFPTRSLLDPGDWPAKDIIALRGFVADHLDIPTRSIWTLAAIYINVEACDCKHLLGGLKNRRITPAIRALVNGYREDGLTWAEIQARFPLYPRVSGLRCLFNRPLSWPAAWLVAPVRRVTWSKEETKRVKDVVWQYYRPGDPSAAADVLVREFPGRPRLAIMRIISRLVFVMLARLRRDIDRMTQLVDVHGADWERIGREMDAPPSMAQQAWLKHQKSTNPAPHANRPWSPDDLAQLQQLAAGYGDGPVDWVSVGKQLGRHSPACITMYYALKRHPPARLRPRPTDPASLEVQWQLAHGSGVDWEQVSQAVGLDVRQCLELSQVDKGKGRWIYDSDTFSWATAERMKAFIVDNYPAPMRANFRAVSNYLWLDMDDCIRMDGVLRGEMERTDELKAQIAEMRRLGMSYMDIGLHLSPCIDIEMVRHHDPRIKRLPKGPLPPADKQHLREFVNARVDKCTFQELRDQIYQKVDGPNRSRKATYAATFAAHHPVFKARADRFRAVWAADGLASGLTITELAEEIDVSPAQIQRLVRIYEKTTINSTRTHAETAQLIDILLSSTRPYPWRFIAKKMATKIPLQCRYKYTYLRKTGKLPAEL